MERINTWAEEYLTIIDTMWEDDNYKEGRVILEKVFLEVPDYAKAHQYAAWYAQFKLRDRKSAIMHYELALKFDPRYELTYLQYAELLIEDKNEQRLSRLKEEGMSYEEVDKAMLLNDYGRVLEVMGKYRAASAIYKEAMKHTMNYWIMNTIKSNRKRVRAKYHLFSAVYSVFI